MYIQSFRCLKYELWQSTMKHKILITTVFKKTVSINQNRTILMKTIIQRNDCEFKGERLEANFFIDHHEDKPNNKL